jgi:hypothetical protein
MSRPKMYYEMFRGIKWDTKLIKELSKVAGVNPMTLKDLIQLLCIIKLIKKRKKFIIKNLKK